MNITIAAAVHAKQYIPAASGRYATSNCGDWRAKMQLLLCAGTGIGVCADPNGVTLPVGGSMPVPTAYFPLTNGSITSWPVPQYWAYNSSAIRAKQTKFVPDDLFGSVASCNASVGASSQLATFLLLWHCILPNHIADCCSEQYASLSGLHLG